MSTEIMKLSPSETYEFLITALSCKQVPYVAGPAAIGKSQIVAKVAKDANAKLIDLRLSQMLSEDMTGLPERNEKTGKAYYLPFDVFPLEGDELPEGKDGWVLFLDELSSASEEVLAASYSLILDRTVGGRKLHDKCFVVAAGNRASDSAIARELPDTLITRMVVCEMKVSTSDWLKWAEEFSGKNEEVIAFIRHNPGQLYAPTKANSRAELETYPTPRGVEKMMAQMNFHEARSEQIAEEDESGIPTGNMVQAELPDAIFNVMVGSVGVMCAQSFRDEYNESIKPPMPWEVTQSPTSTRIPATHVGKTKITEDLVTMFVDTQTSGRDNIFKYMNRIGGEYCELFCDELRNKLPETSSNYDLMNSVYKRLGIDPLLNVPKYNP